MPTYYCDPISGNDGNDGSQGTPWASIDHAKDQVVGGDIVILNDGTYSEDSGSGYLNMQNVGYTSEVIFRAANPGMAIIESASHATMTIFTTGGTVSQNWTFEDVKIAHRTTGQRWLVRFNDEGTNITLRRVTFEIDDTIHASGGNVLYNNGGTLTNFTMEDCSIAITNGQNFGLIQSTGSNIIDGLTVTGMTVTGDSSVAKLINIDDLRGTCSISGSMDSAGTAADTSHVVYIGDAGAACSLGFGAGLTVTSANCRGVSIMEDGTAANMTLTGGDITGTCKRRVFGAEFGVTGYLGTIIGVLTDTSVVNNVVELRSDSTDNGTLAVKQFTVDHIDVTTNTPYHGLLFGRHSEDIEVKSLVVNDGPQNIAFVDKGLRNKIGTENIATIYGGTVGALYLKGARDGVYDNTKIYQDNGGECISFVYDDVALNKTSGNSVQNCSVVLTNGSLHKNAGSAVDDGGNVVDYNLYMVTEGQSWGQVYGTTVTSLETVQTAWDSYDVPTNDENSYLVGNESLFFDYVNAIGKSSGNSIASALLANPDLQQLPATINPAQFLLNALKGKIIVVDVDTDQVTVDTGLGSEETLKQLLPAHILLIYNASS